MDIEVVFEEFSEFLEERVARMRRGRYLVIGVVMFCRRLVLFFYFKYWCFYVYFLNEGN